jgi:adenylate kinase family enzyme
VKVAITGAPRAGKTTLASRLAGETHNPPTVSHTDDFKHLSWSDQSLATALALNQSEVIEGTTVARGLRKWLKANPAGKPVDTLFYLPTSREQLTAGQSSMAQGINTVLREIVPELRARGVTIAVLDGAGTSRRLQDSDLL